jgi:hypothetical protein
MHTMKKLLIETVIAVLCLLPIFAVGYMIGLQLEKTIF